MDDKSVFLVIELWIKPGTFNKLKSYRKKLNDLLEKYNPEIIFHNHAFEWVSGGEEGAYPTGIEIIKFENEHTVRAALAELAIDEINKMQLEIFTRTRCYLSRFAFPRELLEEMNLS